MSAASRPASSRKASTPRANSNVALDLDALDDERPDQPGPYTVKVGGAVVRFRSADDIDWQVAATLSTERPFEFFDALIFEDDKDAFLKAHFPSWKMELLVQSYRKHYGFGDEGNSRG